MEYRDLGHTGWKVSTTGLGTWALGSLWGAVGDRDSLAALNHALDFGVNCIGTPEAYAGEPLLDDLRQHRKDPFYLATKMGMQVNPNPKRLYSEESDRFCREEASEPGYHRNRPDATTLPADRGPQF